MVQILDNTCFVSGSRSFVQRLKLEASLPVHNGCVRTVYFLIANLLAILFASPDYFPVTCGNLVS